MKATMLITDFLGCKINGLLFVFLLSGLLSYAQSNKGDKEFNLGIGMGVAGISRGGPSGLGVNFFGDYAIKDNLGIGAHVAYLRTTIPIIEDEPINHVLIGPRANYHLNDIVEDVFGLKIRKFQTYISGGLLLDFWNYQNSSGTKRYTGTSVNLLLRLGGRYETKRGRTLFADFGTGNVIQFGVSFLPGEKNKKTVHKI